MQHFNINNNGSGLDNGKKEMITMYVAHLHDSFFDQTNLIKNNLTNEYKDKPMEVKLKALISIATNFAKSLGASEQDIHDTVYIPTVRCTYNRMLAAG
jgi:alkylhydroperoxidase/carboxymuconolactone decarboxylase family protein YurZ